MFSFSFFNAAIFGISCTTHNVTFNKLQALLNLYVLDDIEQQLEMTTGNIYGRIAAGGGAEYTLYQ